MRAASQARTLAGSDEHGRYDDTGTRPPWQTSTPRLWSGPVNVGAHGASRAPSVLHQVTGAYHGGCVQLQESLDGLTSCCSNDPTSSLTALDAVEAFRPCRPAWSANRTRVAGSGRLLDQDRHGRPARCGPPADRPLPESGATRPRPACGGGPSVIGLALSVGLPQANTNTCSWRPSPRVHASPGLEGSPSPDATTGVRPRYAAPPCTMPPI
jgi:hypothetical protein